MAPLPPELMEELVEEVLLRFPPDKPAWLVRASLVCKRWCRLISAPGFRRRFREIHRTAPMLGFLCNLKEEDQGGTYIARFFPTSSSCLPHADHQSFALDARHGRVLLHNMYSAPPPQGYDPYLLEIVHLIVWDPTTDEQQELPALYWYRGGRSWKAAVFCAATMGGACDHLDCHSQPFLVVFMGIIHEYIFLYVYSSEVGAWRAPIRAYFGPFFYSYLLIGANLLTGDALHFALEDGRRILTYHFGEHYVSVVTTPALHMPHLYMGNMVMVMTEDGELGVAGVEGYILHMWSWRENPDGINAGRWEERRVIDLDRLVYITIGEHLTRFYVVCFAEGTDIIFISTNDGVFTVELNSCRLKKVHGTRSLYGIVPYVSFYTPDLSIGDHDD